MRFKENFLVSFSVNVGNFQPGVIRNSNIIKDTEVKLQNIIFTSSLFFTIIKSNYLHSVDRVLGIQKKVYSLVDCYLPFTLAKCKT